MSRAVLVPPDLDPAPSASRAGVAVEGMLLADPAVGFVPPGS
jgi:hypothetical protein